MQYKQLPRLQEIFSKSNIYIIKVSKINVTLEKFFLTHDCAIYIVYIVYICIDIFSITDLSLRRIIFFGKICFRKNSDFIPDPKHLIV